MKLEKLSSNQIRCTLTKCDLSSRNMNLHDLAYGTENVRNLFHEMMEQAYSELNFRVGDTPLMIEAMPSQNESIILLITKVENPEELDTRFSTFTPSVDAQNHDHVESSSEIFPSERIDNIINTFNNLHSTIDKDNDVSTKQINTDASNIKASTEGEDENENFSDNLNLVTMFLFTNLDQIIHIAKLLDGRYSGQNTLYKDESTLEYILVINKIPHTPLEFNRICNLLLEYSEPVNYSVAFEAHLAEHATIISQNNALQILATL